MNLTLICLSTDKPVSSLKAMNHCLNVFPHFSKAKLLSSFDGKEGQIEIKKVPVASYLDYNKFMVEDLSAHVKTEHALIVQDDGYIVNPNLWTDDFLQYDYIGAPWPWHGVCGNGGFSLRSKRFLEVSSSLRYEPEHHEYPCAPEDWFLCVKKRKFFEDAGIKFAPNQIAQKFSFETPMGYPNEGKHSSFGFHGKHNL